MKHRFFKIPFLIIAILFTSVANATDNEQVVISFLKHIDSMESISDQKKNEVKHLLKSRPSDGLTDSLIIVYPNYLKAVESSDQKLLLDISSSNDPFLAADAVFYLARAMVNNQQFEDAIPHFEELNEMGNYSTHIENSQYFKGVAQAGLLENDAAIRSLTEFLSSSPDAPERLRVSAWRQIHQLRSIKEGELSDIHQKMDYSKRRLSQSRTSGKTQEEQKEIVRMLTNLIKSVEKKECSSNCKNSNKPDEKPSKKEQSESASNSASDSPESNQAKTVKKSYSDGPASPWSRLRQRSRDPANNAIKEKMPPKYRDIIERYQEAANRK